MKKIYLLLLYLIIVSILVCSRNDIRIIDINNVIWKNEYFNIVSTSPQFQNQGNNRDIYNDDDYYSNITV